MRTYSQRGHTRLGERGRKKAVRKFTIRQGLWMAGMIGAAILGMLLLFLIGFFRLD
jgi:hypothetical protein